MSTGHLAQQNIRIDKIYYCPHALHERCLCRKREIGMFTRAAREMGLSLVKSWVVGDEAKDIVAGREVNAKTIHVGQVSVVPGF